MVIREEKYTVNDIDFNYIKKALEYIKSRSHKSYRTDKSLTAAESANIVAYVDYLEKAIDILKGEII